MRLLVILFLTMVFTTMGYAQVIISPPIEFFMHNRAYDTFLRDYFQFEESNPLRIEYSYTNWLDSGENSGEYRDNLLIECLVPIYTRERFIVNIPFKFSYTPIWIESEEIGYGRKISIVEPHLTTRWTITPKLKSIIGWEYNMKGDGDYLGNKEGTKICFLKGFLSYDLNSHLNIMVGARLDKYFYDTNEKSDTFKITDQLYYYPAAMLNWHPSKNFIVLLGIPYTGAHFAFGNILKAEARLSVDKEVELALKTEPIEKTTATLRFFNTPYHEIPIRKYKSTEEDKLERLSYTDKRLMFEIGRRLNPAAEVSLTLTYALGKDLEIADKNIDGKPRFDIAATFTLELEALTGKR